MKVFKNEEWEHLPKGTSISCGEPFPWNGDEEATCTITCENDENSKKVLPEIVYKLIDRNHDLYFHGPFRQFVHLNGKLVTTFSYTKRRFVKKK